MNSAVVNALGIANDDDMCEKSRVTALHLCALLGFVKGISLLIDAGADPAKRDSVHRTPFKIAIDRKDKKVRDAFRRKMGEYMEAQQRDSTRGESDSVSESVDAKISVSGLGRNAIDWAAAGVAMAGPLMEGDVEAALERKKAARRRARERKRLRRMLKRSRSKS